jgi:hypothetical protein
MNYNEINRLSWISILFDNGFEFQPPVTVHLPIQPVHSPDIIHVDSALNVCRKRVLPKLSTSRKAKETKRLKLFLKMIDLLTKEEELLMMFLLRIRSIFTNTDGS